MTTDPDRRVPVARGDEFELAIDGLGDGPDGIGHVGNYVVFVPGVLPGERALVRITSASRKYGRAELLELRSHAAARVIPACPHFLACGGCHRQHQDYRAQLADKRARLQRAVTFGLGEDAIEADETRGMRPPYGHRHKVVVHLRNTRNNGLESCFHRLRSPELVTVTECPASDALAWDLAQRTVELLHDLPHDAWDPDFAPNGLLRSVLVRSTTIGECYLVLVARDPFVPGFERLFPALHDAGATTIALNGNNGEFSQLLGPETTVLSGPPRITERLGNTTYLLSPGAFFQTSPEGAFQIVQLVLDWLAPTTRDDVADLYCGGGLLTLPLAQRARSAFGVELSRTAVRDAEAAAVQNGLHNVRFASGHVEAWLRTCGRGDVPRPSLVALDPPRTGLTPEGIAGLGHLRPKRIAYVSCDPQALQRDLRELREVGFRLVRAVPVDMFPQTCHLESVAMLERLP